MMQRLTPGRVIPIVALFCLVTLAACERKLGEVNIPIPDEQANVTIRYFGAGYDMPRFEATVTSQTGRLREPLWEDWGPATQGTIYVTPDDQIVIIGSGGFDYIFDLTGEAPRLLPQPERPTMGSENWRFIGAFVMRHDEGQLRFFPPSDMAENIDLLGAGSSPYRKAFQTP